MGLNGPPSLGGNGEISSSLLLDRFDRVLLPARLPLQEVHDYLKSLSPDLHITRGEYDEDVRNPENKTLTIGNASIDIGGIMAVGVMWMPFSCSFLRSWAVDLRFFLQSKFAPRCDLIRLGDRPNLNSSKRVCNVTSIRISRASNLASNKPTDVVDICRKMTAKRFESEGSSDGGGRRGQQQRRLWLRCDFVAAGRVDCSKGAAAIGGRRGSDVHNCCGGGQQWYRARDGCCCVQFVVGRDHDSWQRTIVAGSNVNRLQRKIAAGSFLPQGSLLAAIKEDDSTRLLLAALGSERCVLRLKG
ncbi:hypothetical protein B296_00025146 [Ensete ventricosum]|uniref:Uncharacterized protein n=1 Tax=Ensete ventricosum TaxID=4639 RepID=A0A427AJK3_ENSVE|nr:hypothetical protein B296_00025146 [Ensete ventricosum]